MVVMSVDDVTPDIGTRNVNFVAQQKHHKSHSTAMQFTKVHTNRDHSHVHKMYRNDVKSIWDIRQERSHI
jgi:hypothetical protein